MGIIILVIVVVAFIYFSKNGFSETDRVKWNAETKEYFNNMFEGLISPAKTSMSLAEGEFSFIFEETDLYEAQSSRIYAGGGTKIEGIYIGGGKSTSIKKIRDVDTGTLTITNFCIYFIGRQERRVIDLRDLLSVDFLEDASLVISSKKKNVNSCFKVKNPILWAMLIKRLADKDWEWTIVDDRIRVMVDGRLLDPKTYEKWE